MATREVIGAALAVHLIKTIPATKESVLDAVHHWNENLEPNGPLEKAMFNVFQLVLEDIENDQHHT